MLVALLFPGLLILLMLAMENVEGRLGRGLITDQVEWMLRSELPVDQVESRVAERLGVPLVRAGSNRNQ